MAEKKTDKKCKCTCVCKDGKCICTCECACGRKCKCECKCDTKKGCCKVKRAGFLARFFKKNK